MNDRNVKDEVAQFDADEQDNLAFFKDAGASDAGIKAVERIIADERQYVEMGEETAAQAEDNVDDRADIALDPENDDDDNVEDVVQSIEADQRALEQQLYGNDR